MLQGSEWLTDGGRFVRGGQGANNSSVANDFLHAGAKEQLKQTLRCSFPQLFRSKPIMSETHLVLLCDLVEDFVVALDGVLELENVSGIPFMQYLSGQTVTPSPIEKGQQPKKTVQREGERSK